jgi:hypothetical protein
MGKEQDIVLIYFEDQPVTFARIEKISQDIKKDWYHVKLLMLQKDGNGYLPSRPRI